MRAGWRGSAALTASFALAFAAAYVLGVLVPAGQRFDAAAFGDLAPVHQTLLGPSQGVRAFVPGLLGAAVAVLAVTAFARRRTGDAVRAILVLAVAGVVGSGLKNVMPRPFHGEVFAYADNTFPSGHAAFASAALIGIAALAPRRGRRVLVPAATVLAVAVSLASLVSYAHRPSDAVGGACLAAVVAGLAWWGRPAPLTRRPWLGAAAVGAVLVSAGVVLLGRALEPPPGWLAVTGCLGLAGVPVLAVLGVVPRDRGGSAAARPRGPEPAEPTAADGGDAGP